MKLLTLILILLHVSQAVAKSNLRTLIETKQYQTCYDQALQNPSFEDPRSQEDLAKCAQEVGDDTMAIAALERVLFLEPDNVDAMIALLEIYNRLELGKQKSLISDSLRSYQLTPEQRTRLNTLTSAQTQKLSSLSASLSLGGGYDTNLNILPGLNVVESPYLKFNTAVSFVHRLEEEGGWFLTSNLFYLHQSNANDHFFDLDYAKLSGGVGYKFKTSTLTLPIYYRRAHYLHADLVHEYGLEPKMDIALSKSVILTFNGFFGSREFLIDPYKKSDFQMFGGGLGGLWLFGADYLYLKGIYKSFFAAKAQNNPYTQKRASLLTAGGNYGLTQKLRSSVQYIYRYNAYDDFVTTTNRRHDDYHALVLGLDYTLYPHWKLLVTYTNSANFSNYAVAGYRKQISEVLLQYNY